MPSAISSFSSPFMFTNAQGEILKVQTLPLVSVSGLELLEKEAKKLIDQPNLLAMVQALKSSLASSPIQNVWGACRLNDLDEAEQKKWNDHHSKIASLSNRPASQDVHGYKQMYVAIIPGGLAKSRKNDHIWQTTPFTSSPSTWGWLDDSIESMLPALSKFAKQHDVSISSRTLSTVFKWKRMFESKQIKIEDLSGEQKWVRSTSLALFHPEHGGYVSAQNLFTDLAGARLFASKSVLDAWLKKNPYKDFSKCVLVEVQSRVVSYDPSMLTGKHAAEFQESMCVLEKEDLENAINLCRAQSTDPTPSAPKKKM